MNALLPAFLRLVRLDLRLMGRRISDMTRGGSGRRTILFVILALIIFHGLAWPVAQSFAKDVAVDPHAADLPVAAGLAFVLPWIISQALTNATRALYSRGDIDLLLASPLPPAALFASRALGIAIESCVSVAIFLLPVANALAFADGVRWLAIYPFLAICGLFGTAVGLVGTMALFHLAGPRRTRTLSQVFATLVGATFALGIQAANFAPAWMEASMRTHLHDMRALALPIAAAQGDIDALLLLGFGALGAFVAVSTLLGVAFTRGMAQTWDTPSVSRAASRRTFRTGPGPSLRRKEWRLLRRDPWLASQMLLQVAYTVPLCFVLWEVLGPEQGRVAAIGPAVVVIAAQLAGALAWISLSTEDAPELLATAPLAKGVAERAKLSAVAIPLIAALGVPLLVMTIGAPAAALATLIFAVGGAASTALLNLWRPAPAKRGDIMRRPNQSKLIGILEHALALFWAVAIALYSAGSLFFLAPVALAVFVLLASRPARNARTSVA